MFEGVKGVFRSRLTAWLLIKERAFFIAKKWEIASRSGGSPTAFDLKIVFSSLKVFSRSFTLNSLGISRLPGILYVDGPTVNNFPDWLKNNSSHVSQPRPCTNPPSTCPISIASFRDLPQSSTM